MKQRYLITGGTGFIGANIVRNLLSEKKEVHLFARPEAKFWRLNDVQQKIHVHLSDLSNSEELHSQIKRIKPSIIIHLATNGAYSSQSDGTKIIHTNIVGTWNLLQAIEHISLDLFINTGSSSEYGYKSFAMRETDSLEPSSYYAVTKAAQSMLCDFFSKQQNKSIVTIRPFSVYGPYEEPGRLIPNLCRALFTQSHIDLVQPTTARDFVHVDDMVAAFRLAERLNQPRGDIFNIGTGVQTTMKDLIETMEQATKRKLSYNWGAMQARKWDTDTWVADISKARKLLNWMPQYTLSEGLLQTWRWYKQHHAFYA